MLCHDGLRKVNSAVTVRSNATISIVNKEYLAGNSTKTVGRDFMT